MGFWNKIFGGGGNERPPGYAEEWSEDRVDVEADDLALSEGYQMASVDARTHYRMGMRRAKACLAACDSVGAARWLAWASLQIRAAKDVEVARHEAIMDDTTAATQMNALAASTAKQIESGRSPESFARKMIAKYGTPPATETPPETKPRFDTDYEIPKPSTNGTGNHEGKK